MSAAQHAQLHESIIRTIILAAKLRLAAFLASITGSPSDFFGLGARAYASDEIDGVR